MKLCGIIAEFNPFTNGHSYIINQAKKQTGLDVLCLMSGNLVQRGELAIIDKYKRATTAINEGASFCFELPVKYAISSAQNFAEGAIKILKELGCVSHLAFGIKLNDVESLKKIAYIKANEPKIVSEKFKQYTKLGLNYNNAMFKVYNEVFPEYAHTLETIQIEPNNILALEYLTAIYKLKANIEPVFIQRTDNGYNSNKPIKVKLNNKNVYFVSASKIRTLVKEGKKINKFIPKCSYEYFNNCGKLVDSYINAKFEALVLNNVRHKSYQELESIYDYNKNFAHLIKDGAMNQGTLNELVEALETRSIRAKRIKRLLIYAYLNLTKETYKAHPSDKYVNILAVDKLKKFNLTAIAQSSNLNLIISHKHLKELESKGIKTLEQQASDLFNISHGLPVSIDLTKFI